MILPEASILMARKVFVPSLKSSLANRLDHFRNDDIDELLWEV